MEWHWVEQLCAYIDPYSLRTEKGTSWSGDPISQKQTSYAAESIVDAFAPANCPFAYGLVRRPHWRLACVRSRSSGKQKKSANKSALNVKGKKRKKKRQTMCQTRPTGSKRSYKHAHVQINEISARAIPARTGTVPWKNMQKSENLLSAKK